GSIRRQCRRVGGIIPRYGPEHLPSALQGVECRDHELLITPAPLWEDAEVGRGAGTTVVSRTSHLEDKLRYSTARGDAHQTVRGGGIVGRSPNFDEEYPGAVGTKARPVDVSWPCEHSLRGVVPDCLYENTR